MHQQLYSAIVFKHLPASPDFTKSDQVTLPGRHTAAAAWEVVYAELRGSRGAHYVGGTVKACARLAENDAERDAENRS